MFTWRQQKTAKIKRRHNQGHAAGLENRYAFCKALEATTKNQKERKMSKVPASLMQSLNKNISSLCPFSIGNNSSQNHCAHYVSHIMGYEFAGATCKNFTWADKQKPESGATIRVDDLFKKCPETGLLTNKPAALTECLIFVTLASNVAKVGTRLTMGNNPRKHVGILTQGKVWNYSNTTNKVVSDLLASFTNKFSHAYKTSGTTVEFYYGKFI